MDKEQLKQRCLDAIDANRDLIIQLGNDVYKTPELGFKEFQTTKRVEEAFREMCIRDRIEGQEAVRWRRRRTSCAVKA